MHILRQQVLSNAFHAYGLRPDVVAMGHVLNIDHFQMAQPTFPPHPHAGFSAVTWMLPWSPGAFTNRDSRGDRSRIGPGSLHWTRAGAGMLHEEIPEAAGVLCEGLQIFVKLSEDEELTPPVAYHVDAGEVATRTNAGATLRVLVGDVDGLASSLPPQSDTTLAHVSVHGKFEVDVPAGVDAFAMVLAGSGRIAGVIAAAHQAAALAPGPLTLEGEGFEVLLGFSPPMPQRPTFRGPFCMFRPERLADAAQRFQSGGMGTLAPSPVAWSRPTS
jgi:redox-sensitive bicupin YhaK (pirin superfamily)